MNSIPQQQNQPHQLERLGAFSQLYLQAKRLLALNVVLSVPLAIGWAFAVAVWQPLEVYAALWGLGLTLLTTGVITPHQNALQTTAAKVQQQLDCELFQLECNIANPPDPETLYKANKRYLKREKSYAKLEDWYPPGIAPLPLELARLVCQRTNCWWDSDLRRRYSGWVITLLVLLSVGVLLIGLIGGLTLDKFLLAVIAPLSPALFLGISQYRDNMKAAANLDRLLGKVNEIWHRSLYKNETPQQLYEYSMQLQNDIFENRANSPLIFNGFYKRLRNENQESMNKAAGDLVKEALEAMGQSPQS